MENAFTLLKRPSRREDEDDIERLQQEFLSGQLRPSVEVKKVDEGKDESYSSKQPPQYTFEDADSITPVIHDIVERDIVPGFSPVLHMPCPKGFPDIPQSKAVVKGKKGKKSIFSQRMEAAMKTKSQVSPSSNPAEGSDLPKTSRSFIIDGSGLSMEDGQEEALKIHEENLAKLSSLPEETILAQKKQIMENLSPDIVNFLKNRRKASNSSESHLMEGKKVSMTNKNDSGNSSKKFQHEKSISSTLKPSLSGDPNEKVLKMSGEEREAILLESIQDEYISDAAKLSSNNQLSSGNVSEDIPEIVESDLPVDELPINPNETGQWLHMSKVEKDKLKWMTLLPKPEPVDARSGYAARFNFQGKLLSREEDIPTIQGLHHHSNEPEIPGYSVEELFLLARSSFQSQRITALETLSHILENYWNGCFDECFEAPLLSTLLQSGLVPLLRWALDDTTIPSVAAALHAMHRLLVCSSDELSLDWTFCWPCGYISPFLTAKDEETSNVNVDELTDAALTKLDVIKGLLRMDILPRFKYILRVMCPPTSVCQIVVEICIRIARHSHESANKVMEFPGLVGAVFLKFLPVQWNCNYRSMNTADYYCPMPSALKLMRIIASADRNLALTIVKYHHLAESLKCYLTIDPSDKKLPPVEVQKLMIESFRMWHVLLNYGFCVDIYLDLFPLLLKHFQFCQSLSINDNPDNNIHNYQYAAHFLRAMTAVVSMVGIESSHLGGSETVVLSCNDVAPLLGIAEACLSKWLWEFTADGSNQSGRVLLASCFDFVSSYFKKISTLPMELSSIQHSAEKISSSYLCPFLTSHNFDSCLSHLSASSVLLNTGTSGCRRDAKVLTSIGSIFWQDDLVPILKDDSSFPLVISVSLFIGQIVNLKPELGTELSQTFLGHDELQSYLNLVTKQQKILCHWFDHFETYFLCTLIELSTNISESMSRAFWYDVSICLLYCLKKPHEWYMRQIMQKIIFNNQFLEAVESTEKSLGDSEHLINREAVMRRVSDFYAGHFVSVNDLKALCFFGNEKLDAVLTQAYDSSRNPICDRFWPLTPIYELYQQSKFKSVDKASQHNTAAAVESYLEWIHYSMTHHNPVMKCIKPEVTFCHLCLVFLIDGELFVVPKISDLLLNCLQNIIDHHQSLNLINFRWKDISSSEIVFTELVEQFEAVSYGDSMFAAFVTFFLQQQYPSKWKVMVLADHPQATRFLSIPLKKLPVPLKNYLEPVEKDTELLRQYFLSLSTGLLNSRRNPILFLMSIHHLHHFIYSEAEGNEFQKVLSNTLKKSKQKDVVSYIMNYSQPNLNSEFGFDMNDELKVTCR